MSVQLVILRSSGANTLSPQVRYKHSAALRPGLDVLSEIQRRELLCETMPMSKFDRLSVRG